MVVAHSRLFVRRLYRDGAHIFTTRSRGERRMKESERVKKYLEKMMEKAEDLNASNESIYNAHLSLIALELAEIVDVLRDAKEREDES